MGGAVFPPCYLTWGQTMVEVMKIMATSFKRSQARTAALRAPSLQQATTDPHLCRRLLDTHERVWVSLLWGHCSFLLGPGVHKVLFVPSKSLFPQSCVSSGSSMVGLMVTSSKRAYAIPRSTAPRAPAPAAVHCWPAPPEEVVKHSSDSVSVGSLGPGMQKVCVLVVPRRIHLLGEEHRRPRFDLWSGKIPCKATKPMHHNYRAYALEPRSHKLSPRARTTERKQKC